MSAHSEILDKIDNIKEKLSDGDYLYICNKLKELNEKKYCYYHLTINPAVKKIIKRANYDFYKGCHNVIIKAPENEEEAEKFINEFIPFPQPISRLFFFYFFNTLD